jgi:hypothetical protein
MWKFVVEEVNSDEDLDGFIKSQYGLGCKLGEKVPIGQEGVYEVGVGEEEGASEVECPHLHWRYATGYEVRYHESANKVIAMYLNGHSTFLGDERGFLTYDEEMYNSISWEAR